MIDPIIELYLSKIDDIDTQLIQNARESERGVISSDDTSIPAPPIVIESDELIKDSKNETSESSHNETDPEHENMFCEEDGDKCMQYHA